MNIYYIYIVWIYIYIIYTDIEGYELTVLNSINFDKIHFNVLLIEGYIIYILLYYITTFVYS